MKECIAFTEVSGYLFSTLSSRMILGFSSFLFLSRVLCSRVKTCSLPNPNDSIIIQTYSINPLLLKSVFS